MKFFFTAARQQSTALRPTKLREWAAHGIYIANGFASRIFYCMQFYCNAQTYLKHCHKTGLCILKNLMHNVLQGIEESALPVHFLCDAFPTHKCKKSLYWLPIFYIPNNYAELVHVRQIRRRIY